MPTYRFQSIPTDCIHYAEGDTYLDAINNFDKKLRAEQGYYIEEMDKWGPKSHIILTFGLSPRRTNPINYVVKNVEDCAE